MALITVGMPLFSGEPDEDINRFVDLFKGYLAGLGIDPTDAAAGPPSGRERALGLFRGCMQGEAAVWYDETFLGKHWKLNNLYQNHGQANWAALVVRTMANLNTAAGSNSFRAGSPAAAYADAAANAAITLANSGLLPPHGIDQDWTNIGGRPTDDPVTVIAAGGPAQPIVIAEIRIGNVIWWFKTQYTTVLREKRELRFGNLVKENDPIRAFYKKITNYGRMLNLPYTVIEEQFFRGLPHEDMLEIERIGTEKTLSDLVDTLEKIEKRKAMMKLGITNKKIQQDIYSRDIIPTQVPPVSQQEPTILKPVTSQGITHEQLDQLLKAQAENLTKAFQAQLQTLQESIKVQPVEHIQREAQNDPIREYMDRYTDNFNKKEGSTQMQRIKLINRALELDEREEIDRKLARLMSKLSIRDSNDTDTSNLVRGKKIVTEDDDDTFSLMRKKK